MDFVNGCVCMCVSCVFIFSLHVCFLKREKEEERMWVEWGGSRRSLGREKHGQNTLYEKIFKKKSEKLLLSLGKESCLVPGDSAPRSLCRTELKRLLRLYEDCFDFFQCPLLGTRDALSFACWVISFCRRRMWQSNDATFWTRRVFD